MSITLRECGRTFWIVPEEPCNRQRGHRTDERDAASFTTSMKAEVCPEGMPGKEITERTCYIGVPKFGEDTGELSPVGEADRHLPLTRPASRPIPDAAGPPGKARARE